MANNDIQPSNKVKQILTKASDEELTNSINDEYGVKYSSDGKKLIKAPNDIQDYIIKPGTQVICDEAFCGCSLTSIIIPDSVTHMGRRAFSCCTGLSSITIPNSVSEISDDAFSDCIGLTSVIIPNSVTHIGFEAFFGCTGLTSIEIPKSVTHIHHNAFDRCRNLKSVIISSPVIYLGIWAFKDCRNLRDVTFRYHTNVEQKINIEIDEMAFMRCPIESLVIPISHEEEWSRHFINQL